MSNAIDGTERWWQSPPLSRGLVHNEVNVTLDLGQVRWSYFSLLQTAVEPLIEGCGGRNVVFPEVLLGVSPSAHFQSTRMTPFTVGAASAWAVMVM